MPRQTCAIEFFGCTLEGLSPDSGGPVFISWQRGKKLSGETELKEPDGRVIAFSETGFQFSSTLFGTPGSFQEKKITFSVVQAQSKKVLATFNGNVVNFLSDGRDKQIELKSMMGKTPLTLRFTANGHLSTVRKMNQAQQAMRSALLNGISTGALGAGASTSTAPPSTTAVNPIASLLLANGNNAAAAASTSPQNSKDILVTQMEELKRENEELKLQLNGDTKTDALISQIEEMKRENESLLKRLESDSGKAEDGSDFEKLEKENLELIIKIQSLENQISELQQKQNETAPLTQLDSHSDCEQKIREKVDKLEEFQQICESLQQKLSDSQKKENEISKRMEESEKRAQELSEQLRTLQENSEKEREEKRNSDEIISINHEDKLQELEVQLRDLNLKLETSNSALLEKQNENESLKKELNETQEEVQRLDVDAAECQTTIENLKTECHNLKSENKAHEEFKQQVEEERKKTARDIRKLQDNEATLMEVLVEKETALEEHANRMKGLVKINKDLEKSLEDLKSSVASSSLTFDDKDRQIRELRNEIKDLEGALIRLKDLVTSVSDSEEKKEKENIRLKQINSALEEESIAIQFSSLVSKALNFVIVEASKTENANRLETLKFEQKKEVHSIEIELQQAEVAQRVLKDKFSSVQMRCEELERETDEQLKTFQKQVQDLTDQLERTKVEDEGQIKSLQKQVQELTAALDRSKLSDEDQAKDLQRHVDELNAALETSEFHNKKLISELNKSNEQLTTQISTLSEFQQNIEHVRLLEVEILELKEIEKSLKIENENCKNENEVLQKLLNELSQNCEKLTEKLENEKSKNSDLMEEGQELFDEHETLKENFELLQTKNEEISKENSILRQQLTNFLNAHLLPGSETASDFSGFSSSSLRLSGRLSGTATPTSASHSGVIDFGFTPTSEGSGSGGSDGHHQPLSSAALAALGGGDSNCGATQPAKSFEELQRILNESFPPMDGDQETLPVDLPLSEEILKIEKQATESQTRLSKLEEERQSVLARVEKFKSEFGNYKENVNAMKTLKDVLAEKIAYKDKVRKYKVDIANLRLQISKDRSAYDSKLSTLQSENLKLSTALSELQQQHIRSYKTSEDGVQTEHQIVQTPAAAAIQQENPDSDQSDYSPENDRHYHHHDDDHHEGPESVSRSITSQHLSLHLNSPPHSVEDEGNTSHVESTPPSVRHNPQDMSTTISSVSTASALSLSPVTPAPLAGLSHTPKKSQVVVPLHLVVNDPLFGDLTPLKNTLESSQEEAILLVHEDHEQKLLSFVISQLTPQSQSNSVTTIDHKSGDGEGRHSNNFSASKLFDRFVKKREGSISPASHHHHQQEGRSTPTPPPLSPAGSPAVGGTSEELMLTAPILSSLIFKCITEWDSLGPLAFGPLNQLNDLSFGKNLISALNHAVQISAFHHDRHHLIYCLSTSMHLYSQVKKGCPTAVRLEISTAEEKAVVTPVSTPSSSGTPAASLLANAKAAVKSHTVKKPDPFVFVSRISPPPPSSTPSVSFIHSDYLIQCDPESGPASFFLANLIQRVCMPAFEALCHTVVKDLDSFIVSSILESAAPPTSTKGKQASSKHVPQDTSTYLRNLLSAFTTMHSLPQEHMSHILIPLFDHIYRCMDIILFNGLLLRAELCTMGCALQMKMQVSGLEQLVSQMGLHGVSLFSNIRQAVDVLCLPKDLLKEKKTRMEVCPTLSNAHLRQLLLLYRPDEFDPERVSEAVLKCFPTEKSTLMAGTQVPLPSVSQLPKFDDAVIPVDLSQELAVVPPIFKSDVNFEFLWRP